MSNQHNNVAYIVGQNLHMGTTKLEDNAWRINLKKFRVYLNDHYHVQTCYYFLGFINEDFQDLYTEIQESGFVLQFREHSSAMLGKKKGNVDSDIIFHIMKKLYKKEDFGKIVLVSGDGDYKMLVDFLIQEKKFEKMLFPNKKFASSLYKKLGSEFYDYLDKPDIRRKIAK
ncbi:MAG: NYN domain-containing protein [bacterium]|nr:NYN domain-containing protein [bacterium]